MWFNMLRKSKYIICLILTAQVAIAQDAKYLKKDTPAPFDGFLITSKRVEELKIGINERDRYKLLNESLERSLVLEKENNELQEKKVNLLTEQNDKLAKTLGEERNVSDLTKILWFSLGVIATGFAIYGVKQLQK